MFLFAFLATVTAAALTSSDKSREAHGIVNPPPPEWPYQTFKSSPNNPPIFDIKTYSQQSHGPGLIFITPANAPDDTSPIVATKKTGPIIATDTGELVWNGPDAYATNLRVASFEKQPILTYWTGIATEQPNYGHGYGNITYLDSSYNELLVLCPHFDLVTPDDVFYACQADLHESYATDRDTLIVTAYNATPADLSAVPGGTKDGWAFDSLFYELNPRTHEVLFKWSSLQHVPVTASKRPLLGSGLSQSVPFDYFHINSVAPLGDKYLVNSRHTSSCYLVDANGSVEWTLNGDNGGDFGSLHDNAQFAWEHHVRPRDSNSSSMIITMFNNDNTEFANGINQTTGLEFLLPLPPNPSNPESRPKLLKNLVAPDEPVFADTQGSVQPLANGNVFMQYGQVPLVREWSPNGDLIWAGRFGVDNLSQSYRGYKVEWHGMPKTAPNLAVGPTSAGPRRFGDCRLCKVAAYASWNGATDVTEWAVWEGNSGARLNKIGRVDSKGFETAFDVTGPCVQVAPVVGGEEQLKSAVACVKT